MADGEPHFASHLNRRKQAIEGNQAPAKGTPLFKVIMGFNLLMTVLVTILTSKQAETLPHSAITGFRLFCYIAPLILFFIVAVIITIGVSFSNRSNVPGLIESLFVGTCLTIAGELYLSGDNIRILYKEFSTNVTIAGEVIQAKDLRSHLVAISLGFMIISQIGPIVSRLVSDYRRRPSTLTLFVYFDTAPDRTNNAFWETYKQIVLFIPTGYHPAWKEGRTLVFEQQCNAQYVDLQRGDSELFLKTTTFTFVHGKQKLIQKSLSDITILRLHFFQNTKDFVEATEIEVINYTINIQEQVVQYNPLSSPVTVLFDRISIPDEFNENFEIKGKSPTFKMSNNFCTWSAEFEISQDNVQDTQEDHDSNNIQRTPFQMKQMQKSKTASLSLLGACFALLDYALIADALYTTLLDEITQHNKTISEGFDCPGAHVGVAKSMYGLITTVWILVIVVILPMGFCCCNKHYPLLGEWEEIRKKIDILPQIQLVSTSIWDKLAEKNIIHKKARIIKISKQITSSYCSMLIFTVIILGIFVLTIPLVTIWLIFIIIILGILAITIPLFTIWLIFIIIVMIVYFLWILCYKIKARTGICPKCTCTSSCCHQTQQDNNRFKKFKDKVKRILKSCNFWITFSGVIAMSLYLPVYLVADNSWPWICDTKEWTKIRISLLVSLFFLIFAPMILYGLLKCVKNFKFSDKWLP